MVVGDQLTELHFTAQNEAAGVFEEVQIVELDPLLRGLLFTDGTVSRTLEAQMLSAVTVDPLGQAQASPPAQVARYLDVDEGEDCLRRRVVMSSPGTRLSVWAESYVLPQRLPAGFVGSLGESPKGIGGALRALNMEDRRELLWFGLAPPPPWSGGTEVTTTLTRCYRIITQGRPALWISEAFAVQARQGVYGLLDLGDSPADLASRPAEARRETRFIDRDRVPSGGGETSG